MVGVNTEKKKGLFELELIRGTNLAMMCSQEKAEPVQQNNNINNWIHQ